MRGRDPTTNLDNLTMKNLANQLDTLILLLGDAQCIVNHLESLRQQIDEDEWETICDSPLGSLLCACMDLEFTLEKLQ